MAIKIKDVGTLANKFQSRAAAAQNDYQTGVQNAGNDWEQKAIASAPAWQQGVTQAAADGRFAKGVQGSAARYQRRASDVGPQRYQTGVQGAGNDWAAGFQPYAAAIAAMDLPPRGPRRSPQNMNRANAVATKLAAVKTGKAS